MWSFCSRQCAVVVAMTLIFGFLEPQGECPGRSDGEGGIRTRDTTIFSRGGGRSEESPPPIGEPLAMRVGGYLAENSIDLRAGHPPWIRVLPAAFGRRAGHS